jgi:hypothetical protein
VADSIQRTHIAHSVPLVNLSLWFSLLAALMHTHITRFFTIFLHCGLTMIIGVCTVCKKTDFTMHACTIHSHKYRICCQDAVIFPPFSLIFVWKSNFVRSKEELFIPKSGKGMTIIKWPTVKSFFLISCVLLSCWRYSTVRSQDGDYARSYGYFVDCSKR